MSPLLKLTMWVLIGCVTMCHDVLFAGIRGQIFYDTLEANGIERTYMIYNPAISDTKKLPLMIVLHGGLGNADSISETTQMNTVADTGQFIVAYPNGTGGRIIAMKNRRTWNAGNCCGQAVKRNVNDVLFLERMIDRIGSKFAVDKNRIYVAGISNGAMMAYRLACEIPDKIAAVIAVSGTLAVDNCDAAKNIPILHIHGDQDENVPFKGGKGARSLSGVYHRSVEDTIDLILRSRTYLHPVAKKENDGIQEFTYCSTDGAPVSLIVVKGGGHVWPGGHGRNNTLSDGCYISASQEAWNFAKQFSKNAKE